MGSSPLKLLKSEKVEIKEGLVTFDEILLPYPLPETMSYVRPRPTVKAHLMPRGAYLILDTPEGWLIREGEGHIHRVR